MVKPSPTFIFEVLVEMQSRQMTGQGRRTRQSCEPGIRDGAKVKGRRKAVNVIVQQSVQCQGS